MFMKKFEIKAFSLDEAKEKAVEMGITVLGNVTPSWKKAHSPISDKDFKLFAVDQLEKKNLTNAEGVGLIVCMIPGAKDTRKRPYEFTNNVTEGKKKVERVFEVRRKDTDELVVSAPDKASAEKLAKEAMPTVKADMYCKIVYHVTEGKDLAFELKYAPSVASNLGTYVVFGNERADF